MISEVEIVIRLVATCFLAGIVGYERQVRNKSAGLRTHILVSLGACLIMILSINIPTQMKAPQPEYTRLAAQVVSGIGFLGAGSIMLSKQGFTVIGLTTAASLWVVAAIGLAAGAGYLFAAGATTLLVYITLTVLSRIELRLKPSSTATRCEYSYLIIAQDKPGQIGKIGAYFGEVGTSIRDIRIQGENEKERTLEIFVLVDAPIVVSSSTLVSGLSSIDGIIAVKTY